MKTKKPRDFGVKAVGCELWTDEEVPRLIKCCSPGENGESAEEMAEFEAVLWRAASLK